MITYRCPSCGKQHTASPPSEPSSLARCLRCGTSIPLEREALPSSVAATGSPGLREAITRQPAEATRTPIGTPFPAKTSNPHESTFELDVSNGIALAGQERLLDPSAGKEPAVRKDDPPADSPEKESAVKAKGKKKPEGERTRERAEDDSKEPKPAKPKPKKEGLKPWQILLGVSVPLLGIGVAGYFVLFAKPRGPAAKGPPPKQVAGKTNPKPSSTPTSNPVPSPKPPEVVNKPTPPVVKPATTPEVRIAASRLAHELTRAPATANQQYLKRYLEVTGLLDRVIQVPKVTPPRHQAIFATLGRPIVCESPSEADQQLWKALASGAAITIRGTYTRDGHLEGCALVPLSPPADHRFRDSEIELVGTVEAVLSPGADREYPTIRLEGDTTVRVDAECVFRKADLADVQKIQPGVGVVVRGTCSGRYQDASGTYHVRLDNCRFVYTTAPEKGIPRLQAAAFSRDYTEDLRTALLPRWGEEEVASKEVSVTELAREFAMDRTILGKKYQHRIVTVSGRRRHRGSNEVILEGEDTNKPLKVQCLFGKFALQDVPQAPQYTIRGLYTGMKDGGTARLDNCEVIEPKKLDSRRLTPDYLPHVAKRELTYDVVLYPPSTGKKIPVIVRQVCTEKDKGVTETIITHMALLSIKSLFDEGDHKRWLGVMPTRKSLLPGPVTEVKRTGGFVEVGQQMVKDKKTVMVWEPVLKIGARIGDQWSWVHEHSEHTYTLVEFKEHRGRPSAVVREQVVVNLDDKHPREITHVYVANVGEVERREWLRVSSTQKRNIAEKRLISIKEATPSLSTR